MPNSLPARTADRHEKAVYTRVGRSPERRRFALYLWKAALNRQLEARDGAKTRGSGN
jgi:hypothetical protein